MDQVPTPQLILASPWSSSWLTAALRAALTRDPVDAARDAELLCRVLGARATSILANPPGSAAR